MLFGLVQKKFRFTGWKEAVLGLACTVAALALGMMAPLIAGQDAWIYITFVYIFFAAGAAHVAAQAAPGLHDHLHVHRDDRRGRGGPAGGPPRHEPAGVHRLPQRQPGRFCSPSCSSRWPAARCRASTAWCPSGTSSKTVSNEKDMLKVGYGAMVLESLLATLALCVAGASGRRRRHRRRGARPSRSSAAAWRAFLEMFGVPVYVAQCFMTMCVSALALTSLDAVARIGRMSFQELFSVDDMAHAEGWRKLLCNTYFATIITLAGGFVLTQVGYSNIWPLFGSANQLLSALVLVTLCVFLKVTGRSNKMLFPPLVIMLCVTFTALVQRLIALVRAFQAGSATFMLEGLQLIIAVLLIALGLTIVVNSLRSYFKARHNSEVE